MLRCAIFVHTHTEKKERNQPRWLYCGKCFPRVPKPLPDDEKRFRSNEPALPPRDAHWRTEDTREEGLCVCVSACYVKLTYTHTRAYTQKCLSFTLSPTCPSHVRNRFSRAQRKRIPRLHEQEEPRTHPPVQPQSLHRSCGFADRVEKITMHRWHIVSQPTVLPHPGLRFERWTRTKNQMTVRLSTIYTTTQAHIRRIATSTNRQSFRFSVTWYKKAEGLASARCSAF